MMSLLCYYSRLLCCVSAEGEDDVTLGVSVLLQMSMQAVKKNPLKHLLLHFG